MSRLPVWLIVPFVAATAFVFSAMAASQPGGVDSTFDPGRSSLGISPGRGYSALIQPDGKVLVSGQFNGVGLDFVPGVVRFNPNGSLDTGFNAAAVPAQNTYSFTGLTSLLALQPNGQILVSGTLASSDGTSRNIARLNADGAIDNTFNPRFSSPATPGIGQAIVLAGGQILVGGNFNAVNGVSRPGIARLNADGSLDDTFQPAAGLASFVVQSTGKIVGISGSDLIRLNPDGSEDNTFVSPARPDNYVAGPLLVQPDDRLIWTIVFSCPGVCIPEYATTILRLNADGTSDGSFQPFSSLGGFPVALQSDGKLLINVIFMTGPSRLNTDGTPDTAFHPNALDFVALQQADGKLITVGGFSDRPYGIRRLFLDGSRDDSFAPALGLTRISSVPIDRAVLLPNGKLAITGAFNCVDHVVRNSIAVLNSDGTVDVGFDAGTLMVPRPNEASGINTLAAQADGKILVGWLGNVMRLKGDGSLDPTFQYTPAKSVTALAVRPDGKIILSRVGELVRLNRDGTIDAIFQPAQTGTVAALQPDGKILVNVDNRLVRLQPDGAVDADFNADKVNGIKGFFGPRFLTQSDGKLLVGRFLSSLDPFALTRLNADGSIDQSFDPRIYSAGVAAADQSGIYVLGSFGNSTTPAALIRLLPDGSRDPSFSVTLNSGATIKTLLLQASGQLIAVGSFNQVNGIERPNIVRLNGNAPRKLGNISTRAWVGRGDSVEIGGFIVTGTAPKEILVRAMGPSLTFNGLSGSVVLANPFLELHDASGAIIARNDNWRDSQEAVITATGIPPADDAESAIVAMLAPGSYTAVVQGADGGNGIALVEMYDLDPAADSALANISTRSWVRANDQAMISGFIMRGPEPSTVVLRAIGPTLASTMTTSSLTDPSLEVYDQSGTLVAANDDWKQTQQAELEAQHICPSDDRESAIMATLAPGSYTTIVRGAHGENGVAVVEVYRLNP